MAQLRRDYHKFIESNTEIVVIGPENGVAFKDYWTVNNLPFVGIPNPDLSILKLFGQEVNLFKLGRMPAQVIIDTIGIARYVHYGKSMSDIPDNNELLELIETLNSEAIEPNYG